MAKTSNRLTRPSGIQTSANGNVYFWRCTVSDQETFADKDRFAEIILKYESEDNLFKTFVLRPVQKYVSAGYTSEQIKKFIEDNAGKLPPLPVEKSEFLVEAPVVKEPHKESFLQNSAIESVASGSYEEPKIKVYAWSGNPDYFKSAPRAFDVSEESKTACIYPNHHLDTDCHGCPVYDLCQCKLKLGEAAWKNPIKRNVVVKKAINSFNVD